MRITNIVVIIIIVCFGWVGGVAGQEDDVVQVFSDGCMTVDVHPVLIGYDVVSYYDIDPYPSGTPLKGSPNFRAHWRGYVFEFANEANLGRFVADPTAYAPLWGGYCSWGVAQERDGWPWAQSFLGPPAGPLDGWKIVEMDGKRRLLFNIWASYTTLFMRESERNLELAKTRWEDWFGPGSVDRGPFNTHCIGSGPDKNWCLRGQIDVWNAEDVPECPVHAPLVAVTSTDAPPVSTAAPAEHVADDSAVPHHHSHDTSDGNSGGASAVLVAALVGLIVVAVLIVAMLVYRHHVHRRQQDASGADTATTPGTAEVAHEVLQDDMENEIDMDAIVPEGVENSERTPI